MLQVRQAEEEDNVVLEQLLSNSPCPAVGLVALLKEGLDVRGLDVEQRLAGLQVGRGAAGAGPVLVIGC